MEARLICVTEENNNKFYNMIQNNDGSIDIEYGRMGRDGRKVHYPAGKKVWNTLLNSKLRKGYQDITSLQSLSKVTADTFKKGTSKEVKETIEYLMNCSKESIKQNYTISAFDVTKIQLDEAQGIINNISSALSLRSDIDKINSQLLKLYTVLPRSMKSVKDHLIKKLESKQDLEDVRSLIDSEQSLLSTLESQVVTGDVGSDILEDMGIDIELETDTKMLDQINTFLGRNKRYAKNIFKVTNSATQKDFDEHVKNSKNKKTALLWHGSRNENWIGIMKKGLVIRPSNAVITGAMFGNGIYLANRAQKSLGYSSLSGSYWTNGNSNKGFLALFSTHLGNTKNLKSHDSSCYKLHDSIGDYDSVFAHKGVDLKNDEIIVYNKSKVTISYLIELEK